MTRTDEELLRAAMRRVGADSAPSGPGEGAIPAPVAQVLRQGRAARGRRRRLAVVATAAVLVGGIAAGSAVFDGVGGRAAPAPVAPPSVSTPAPVLAPPRVVPAWERFDVGYGYTFRMGEDRAVIMRGGCGMVVGLSKPRTDNRIYAQERYDGRLLLVGGMYIGPEPLAGVRVELDGRVLDAQAVTLPGTPGWSYFYVPPVELPGGYAYAENIHITAYGPDGRVVIEQRRNTRQPAPRPGETVRAPDAEELHNPLVGNGMPPSNPPPAAGVPGSAPPALTAPAPPPPSGPALTAPDPVPATGAGLPGQTPTSPSSTTRDDGCGGFVVESSGGVLPFMPTLLPASPPAAP
ncbi:hypothetical protein [Streptodolium elevatio]